jgi:hypothetical protein
MDADGPGGGTNCLGSRSTLYVRRTVRCMSPADFRILIIRHAEKPDPDRGILGVDETGRCDPASLSPRGWQRAGALVPKFSHLEAECRPHRIYAARSNANGKVSHRSIQTVKPLAENLQLAIDTRFGRGDEDALVRDVLNDTTAVLISWQHEGIPAIAARIMGESATLIPSTWPEDRFDMTWLLTRTANAWNFVQIPQHLLYGDRDEPIL